MKSIYFLLCFIGLSSSVNAQIKVKFELQQIAKHKDDNSAYFVAGNFNNWAPNDTNYRFKQVAKGIYMLEKELATGNYEYKITRGSWTKVETHANGSDRSNRTLKVNTDTLIKIEVLNWSDEFAKVQRKHTASAQVMLLDSAFEVPQLNTKRRIWIYLPSSYTASKKKYPVLYMHDGQNLFDEFTGSFGEWGVDETLDSLTAKGIKETIVVGIDNGPERLKEYNPFDSQYGKGKGKEYVEFLVKTLKPYIDQHYRTLKDSKNTAIAGSSMGGLISMYAIATYPAVFGKAGIFSPAFWLGKSIDKELKNAVPNLKGHQIYFVAGTLEGKLMIQDMASAYQILNPTGENKQVKLVEKTDGQHKEWFWRREFVDFYKFISQ